MIRVIWSGVDTLEASFSGDLPGEMIELLDEKKGQAQGDDLPVMASVGGRSLYVQPYGARTYRYVAKDDEMLLRLGTRSLAPALSARLLALGLAERGHKELYASVNRIASTLNLQPRRLSRLDIAVDFQGWAPTTEEIGHVVCNASYRPIFPNLEHPETFYFGKGQIVVRIYNKTKEASKGGKEWIWHVWRQSAEFDVCEDVWRFEGQFRGEILKQLGCGTVEAAFANLPGLLGYSLNWCNLRVPIGENKSRWPEDPKWTELREASVAGTPLDRVKGTRQLAMFSRCARMVLAYAISAAVAVDTTDFEYVWGLLRRQLKDYIAEDEEDFASRVMRRKRNAMRSS